MYFGVVLMVVIFAWLFLSNAESRVESDVFNINTNPLVYGFIEDMTLVSNVDYKGTKFETTQINLLAKFRSFSMDKNIIKVCFPKYFYFFEWCVNTEIYDAKRNPSKMSLFRVESDLSSRTKQPETVIIEKSDLNHYLKKGDDLIVKLQYLSGDNSLSAKNLDVWSEEYFRQFVKSGSVTRYLHDYMEKRTVGSFFGFNIEGLLGRKMYAMEIDII